MNSRFILKALWVLLIVLTCFHHQAHAKDSEQISIYIDLWKKELYVIKNESVVKTYPVASGYITSPTPIGEYKVINKKIGWGGGFGTRWLGLNVPWGMYGIHGTNAPWAIGKDVSKGCIRMHNQDVEDLYKRVSIGTPVHIDGPIIGLNDDFVQILARDSRGNLVQLVQNRLQALGVYYGKCHGIYDGYTEMAVKEFQRKMNLPITGYITYRDYLSLGIIE